MTTGSIIDFSVKIIPSEKLIKYIKGIKLDDTTPSNIRKIQGKPKKNSSIEEEGVFIANEPYTEKELEILEKLSDKIDCKSLNFLSATTDENDARSDKTMLVLQDLKWLNKYMVEERKSDASNKKSSYLHQLLQGCKLLLPENEILERDPELEARCQRLKLEQEELVYRKMTKDVDPTKNYPEDSIGYQLKALDRHLIAILQFIFSIITGFLFGFLGIELMIGDLDFGFRLLLGIICALIVAIAEIYFLAKKLNEEDSYIDDSKNSIKQKPKPQAGSGETKKQQ